MHNQIKMQLIGRRFQTDTSSPLDDFKEAAK